MTILVWGLFLLLALPALPFTFIFFNLFPVSPPRTIGNFGAFVITSVILGLWAWVVIFYFFGPIHVNFSLR